MAYAREWYHVAALALVIVFMFAIRVQAWQKFIVNGKVYFSGNDPWYHLRQVMYTVQHYPSVMPFDVWTGFPTGKTVGQFGTLFDQIVATVALVIGLGSPSDHTIAMTLLFEPAVAGALTAIPVYFLGKRLGGRLGGVVSAVVLALLPGLFLGRSLVGVADHNGTEPLFQAFAVLATMVALTAAQRDYPVWEQVVDRDWDALRSVVGWSALAGVATGLYLWVWPPGVLLVGVFAAFYTVAMCGEYARGNSPDHVAFVGVISMVVTFVMALVPVGESGFAAAAPTLLQPALALLTAGGVVFLAWFAREWDERAVEREYYPAAVVGILIVVAAISAVLLPGVFDKLVNQLVRFVGFTTGATTRTVGEAQPFLGGASTGAAEKFATISQQYGATFYTALLGAAVLIYEPLVRSEKTNELYYAIVSVVAIVLVFFFPNLIVPGVAGALGIDATFLGILVVGGLLFGAVGLTDRSAAAKLLLVYGMFIVSAAFTQVRFNYYLVVPVAVLNGYLVYWIADLLWNGEFNASDIRGDQVIAVAVVLLVLVVPLAAPVSAWTADDPHVTQAGAAADSNGPGSVVGWDSMLTWMNSSTPAEGNYNGTGNADQLDYYGTYSKTDDYQYPDGAYGVMSWWDYGHWITTNGERIPVANPFQQNAEVAANFLLAPNETAAQDVLNNLGESGEQTKYVAVDWKMATTQGQNGKFFAPTVYTSMNVSQYDYFQNFAKVSSQNGQLAYEQNLGTVHTQKYYESLIVRLYRYQGSAVQPSPVVVDWDYTARTNDGTPAARYYQQNGQNDTAYKQFNSMQAARNYVQNDSVDQFGEPTSQVGGVGKYPSEFVPALQHYRMVGTSTDYAPARQVIQGERFSNIPTWAKLYERVPGATVQGQGPANSTVRASVQMDATRIGQNATFTYTQYAQTDENGDFTMTLPYSTTGYSEYGPENGHTNVSVRATGSYEFTAGQQVVMKNGSLQVVPAYSANASVSEGQVIGEDPSAVTVTLEQTASQPPTNSTSGTSTSGDTTASLVEPDTLDADTAALA
ncbi:oligosaccharyl transferase [Halocalculus aciditolerans]|uniref:dolichyl-phosphooligosaccharide-protein glycotransferase n=1 Tax=Halocalculus aciditolerans TaxID=1383812 RepID=A0A830FBS3_9EURY|nr:oligosaccharyl transferase [Halocalculus aciditolerans]